MAYFPTSIKDFYHIPDRILVEGKPLGYSASITSPFTLNQTIGSFIIPPGLVGYVESVTFTSNSSTPILVQVSISNSYYNSVTSHIFQNRGYISSTNPLIIPIRQYFANPANIGFSVREVVSDSDITVSVTMNGGFLTDDLYFNADVIYLVLGDSTTVGSLGASGTFNSSDIYPWKIRDYYRSQKKKIRMINKGLGGKTSTDLEDFRLNQRGVDIVADLVTYSMGINDVSGGTFNEATYTANVNKMIEHTALFNPRRKFVLLGPSPVLDDTRSANLDLLRATAQSIVTGLNDPTVTYINMGTAFDRTDTGKYSSTDVTGDKVHPNISGHLDIFNHIKNSLPTI